MRKGNQATRQRGNQAGPAMYDVRCRDKLTGRWRIRVGSYSFDRAWRKSRPGEAIFRGPAKVCEHLA